MLPNRPDLKRTARKLRMDATVPERLLWSRLRRRAVGYRFLRQRPIGGYVVDFCCIEQRLDIEVDGRSHEGRFADDQMRQRDLEARGLRFLRFTNDDVIADVDDVAERIHDWLARNSLDAIDALDDLV